MHWLIFFQITISLVALRCCHSSYEGSIQEILSEVNSSLTQRLPEDSIPLFMKGLHVLLREEHPDYSVYSRDALYRHSPAIRSFHAISQADTGRQFDFALPKYVDTDDLFSAELMINSSISSINAVFENRNLTRISATLSDQYYVFNVTDIVIQGKMNNDTRVTFTFSAPLDERDVYLVVYEHISSQRLLHSRRRRDASVWMENIYLFLNSQYSQNTQQPGDNNNGCHRMNWTVDFMELNWLWMSWPNSENVGICSSDCNLFSTNVNTTNYSFLKDVYISHHGSSNNISRAVCTPVEFYDMQLLYYTTDGNFVWKILPEMKVKTCACR